MVWEASLSALPALGVAAAGGPQVQLGPHVIAEAVASAGGVAFEKVARGNSLPVDGMDPGCGRGGVSAVAGVPALAGCWATGAAALAAAPPVWDPVAGPPASAETEVGFMSADVGLEVLGLVRNLDQLTRTSCIDGFVPDAGTWRAPAAAGAPGRCGPPASEAVLLLCLRGRAVSPGPRKPTLAEYWGVAP